MSIDQGPPMPGAGDRPGRRPPVSRAGTGRRTQPRVGAVLAGLLASAALGLAGPGGAGASGTPPAGAPATTTTVPGPVTLTVADQEGVLQALFATTDQLAGAGYTVEWVDEPSGAAVLADEATGAVDVGVVGDTPVVFAQAARSPVYVVAVQSLGPAHSSTQAIVVPATSPVHSVKDLAGRTVAVTPGSVGQYLLARALARAGLPYRSVHADPLDPAQAAAAVSAGTVGAAAVGQPELAGLEQGGHVRVLVGGWPLISDWADVVASPDAVDQASERPAVLDFVRRLVNAETLAGRERPALASAWAAQDQLPAAVASAALGRTTATGLKITPAALAYQQAEADLLFRDRLVDRHLDTAREFSTVLNRLVVARRVPVVRPTTTTSSAGPSSP